MTTQPCGDEFLAAYENIEFNEWIEQHKQVIQEKLEQKHNLRKLRRQHQIAEDVKLERKLPMDIMAKEWFNDNPQTGEMSCYLIDRLLPTLIMGLEKVLSEITRKGMLTTYGEDENVEKTFHPLTYLAQYLMRNNPKHSNFPEASPYIRGLRKISEDIKRNVYDIKINKLAQLKQQAKIQTQKMEQNETKREKEIEDREELLKKQFSNWLTDCNDGVHRRAVTYSILSFSQEEAETSSGSLLVEKLNEPEQNAEFVGITIYTKIFIEYSKNFSRERFQELLSHLDRCALSFQKFFEKESLHALFLELFQSLDAEDIGFVDRERILNLVQTFWDSIEEDSRSNFNNPQCWPVVEIAEQINYKTENIGEEESSNINAKEEDKTEKQVTFADGNESEESKPDDESEKEEIQLDVEDKKVEVKSDAEAEETNEENVKPEEIQSDNNNKEKEEVEAEDAEPESDKKEVTPEDANPENGKEEVKPEDADPESDKNEVTPEDAGPESDKEEVKPEDADPESGKEEVKPEDANPESDKNEVTPEDANPESDKEEVKPEDADPESDKKEVTLEDANPESDKKEVTPEDAGPESGKEEVKPEERSNNEELKTVTDETDEVDGNKIEETVSIIVKPEEIEPDDQKEKEEIGTILDEKTVEDKRDVENEKKEINSEADPRDVKNDEANESNKNDEHESDNDSTNDDEEDNTRELTQQLQTIDEEDEDAEKYDDESSNETTKQQQEVEIEENSQANDINANEPQTVLSTTPEEGNTPVDSEQQSKVEEKVLNDGRKYLGSKITFASKSIAFCDAPTVSLMNQRQLRSMLGFYDNKMSKSSFSTLLNNFLNEETRLHHVERLVNHLNSNYSMTEEEKLQRINQNRLQKLKFKQKCLVDDLFDKWDVNSSGLVDANLVNAVLSRYKGGLDTESCLNAADEVMRDLQKNKSSHERFNLTKKNSMCISPQLRPICKETTALENFVSFSNSTIELTFEERIRSEIRRKWLDKILMSSQIGFSMENVYDVLFESILKDAELNGGKKQVHAYVGLLENNLQNSQRGSLLLRYVACTPDLSPTILGRALYEDGKGISFNVVKRGRLCHVTNTQQEKVNDGVSRGDDDTSLLLIPLQDAKRRTFGLLGISSRLDASENGLFSQHEVDFYQGVSSVFSTSFHYIDSRRKLLRTMKAAISWLKRKLSFNCVSAYFVEAAKNNSEEETFSLRMVHSETSGGVKKEIKENCTLNNDNPFQSYLFDCAETSLPMIYVASGVTHAVCPVRDNHGFCQCVVDMSFGQAEQSPLESDSFYAIMNMLQEANIEILREMQTGEKTVVLDAERYESDVIRISLLFGRLMLQTIRSERLKTYNFAHFISLCNREEVSDTFYTLLRGVHLLLFRTDPDEAECLTKDAIDQSNEKPSQSNEEESESGEESTQSDEEVEKQLTKLELCLKMVNDDDFKDQLLTFDPTVKHTDDDETLVPTFETISKIMEQLAGCLNDEAPIAMTIFEWMETNVYIMQSIIETRQKEAPKKSVDKTISA